MYMSSAGDYIGYECLLPWQGFFSIDEYSNKDDKSYNYKMVRSASCSVNTLSKKSPSSSERNVDGMTTYFPGGK